MARGYYLAARRGTPGQIYNLSSGRAWKIREIVRLLLSLSSRKIEVIPEKKRFRNQDISILYGKSDKFRRATGWKPRHRLRESLKDVLNYWRKNYTPGK
jgi:GDP-4-dehydro-6-deoxy-D-mannose reductase